MLAMLRPQTHDLIAMHNPHWPMPARNKLLLYTMAGVFTACAMASGAITDGLIAHWKFDETNGFTAYNSVATNHGGLVNFPAGNSHWTNGQAGGALRFRGPGFNHFVLVTNYPNPIFAMSLSAWVWAEARPTWASIAKNWGGSVSGQFHFGLQDTAGDLSNFLTVSGGSQPNTREGALFPIGSWQHVAFTADGAQMRIYRNGVQAGSVGYGGNLGVPPIKALGIGAKLNDAGTGADAGAPGYWQGRIDDLGMWNRALSEAEILSIYTGGLDGQNLAQAQPPMLGGGSVIITEFMGANSGGLRDTDGDSSDWIEIYNGTGSAVNLAGWSLSDAANNVTKWRFPATNLAANGYLIVFASEKDRAVAGRELHTNFRLSTDGEYLALADANTNVISEFAPAFPAQVANVSYGVARLTAPVTFISTGSVVRVHVPASDALGTNWLAVAFDDRAWIQGANGVGFENSPGDPVNYAPMIGTDVGSLMFDRAASCYVRLPLVVSNVTQFTRWKLRMQYDDGFVAWLNGEEVVRRNAPASLAWNSVATAEREDTEAIVPEVFDLSLFAEETLVPGTNILAIQLLNTGFSSSDLIVLPVVEAVSAIVEASGQRYFVSPTPGSPNVGGAERLGPVIRNVTHTPLKPHDMEDIQVTAEVTPAFAPVSSVTLRYRVMFSNEVALSMFDDGAHGDGTAGDRVYGAAIPAAASTNGQMVRWTVSALDTTNQSRAPLFLDPDGSPEYFGAVIVHPGLTSNLPIVHWFVSNAPAAETGTGTRCSLYYLDEFYDNVFIRIRGGTARSWPKKSYKVQFNEDHLFCFRDGVDRVDEVNLNATYTDKAYVRAVLTYEFGRDAGTPGAETFFIQMRQNNVFYSVAHMVEQPQRAWLRRHGQDPNGAFYKGGPGANMDSLAGFEKKTRLNESTADLTALLNGVRLVGTNLERFVFDHVDIPAQINYMATLCLSQNIDASDKNYFLYRDTVGSGEWHMTPWDLDLTFGPDALNTDTIVYNAQNTNAPACASHPFIGARPWMLHAAKYNRLQEAIVYVPRTREMLLRRIRTMTDQFLAKDYFQTRLDQLAAQIGTDVLADKARWGASAHFPGATYTLAAAIDRVKNEYLAPRLPYLLGTNIAGVGLANPFRQPLNVPIQIVALEVNPASGDQEEEYVCLTNANPLAVDLSGWRLDGEVQFTFDPGTVIPAANRMYVAANVAAFRRRLASPRGDEGHFVQGNYDGKLSARGGCVRLFNQFGIEVNALSYPAAASPAQEFLRVTEMMYHPAGDEGAGEYEFIELRNIGPDALDLTGVRFSEGISFQFGPGAVLDSGNRLLLVKNLVAFTARYGSAFSIAGEYAGQLENNGERLRLEDAAGEKILEFAYDNSWHPITDGHGFSLVIINEAAPWDTWQARQSWRASGTLHGDPGTVVPPLTIVPIVINEALTRTDLPPPTDSIELFNPTTNTVDLGGWFLTDDFNTPKKFRIETGAMIAPLGYRVFTEADFNTSPGQPPSFALGSDGDEVWLFSGDGQTNLTGYVHGFAVGAAENGVSFGRHLSAAGEEHFVAQTAQTLDAPNAGPRVGPVIISEIMFHPPDLAQGGENSLDEFIELQNISSEAVPLFDSVAPANTWRLRNAVDFEFPSGASLAAGGFAVVVTFDPLGEPSKLNAFRARYGLSPAVSVFGPYRGQLDNSDAGIELFKPDSPVAGVAPYILVERVHYADDAPWPAGADGSGASLQRRMASEFGDDAVNWQASAPTAGAVTAGGLAPQFTAEPQSQTVVAFQAATFTAGATGDAPLRYQWAFNDSTIADATGPTLTLSMVQPENFGQYSVTVFNAAGAATSSNALLNVIIPATIAVQPRSQNVRAGSNAVFSVLAFGTGRLRYQWQADGHAIDGATNTTLTLTNVQIPNNGAYVVVITDEVGPVTSDPAVLGVLVRPGFTLQPVPAYQEIVVGGTASFTVSATGSPPPLGYRWRRNGSTVVVQTNTTLILTNVQLNQAGTYTVVATNLAGAVLSSNAVLVVLADTDHDGLADRWEIAHGLNTNDIADAALDADGDTMNNHAEYIAGTNPTNALSYLKVERVEAAGGGMQLEFMAVSNRAYSILVSTNIGLDPWTKLFDVLPRQTNRVETIVDPAPAPQGRFYQLATPAFP